MHRIPDNMVKGAACNLHRRVWSSKGWNNDDGVVIVIKRKQVNMLYKRDVKGSLKQSTHASEGHAAPNKHEEMDSK